ncbi:MAG: hypothetical protein IT529_13690 [Burkholderiales bacterium]|nr:hypothetical protein [Burkholderiales bacterium]
MMSHLDDTQVRRDALGLPSIRLALVLSAVLHVLLLGRWLPHLSLPAPDEPAAEGLGRSLVVTLAAPPAPPPAPPATADLPARRPEVRSPAPVPRRHPRAPAPVIAIDKPAPGTAPRAQPAPVAPPAAPPSQPAPAGDLSSFIAARRSARAGSEPPPPAAPAPAAPPAEDETARANRAVAANLGLNRTPSFGPDPTRTGGGIFQLQRVGVNDAEFFFYGWNNDIRRNTTQMIEVQKGSNPDIRIAVVRRMIAIIREHEREDFLWDSPRLGRSVMLSARARDTSGLEDFMLMEFFHTTQVPR